MLSKKNWVIIAVTLMTVLMKMRLLMQKDDETKQ